MPKNNEKLKPKIDYESSVNQTLRNDTHSLDQQSEQYRSLLIHDLNNDPNKYASLDTCQKDNIKFLLSIYLKIIL